MVRAGGRADRRVRRGRGRDDPLQRVRRRRRVRGRSATSPRRSSPTAGPATTSLTRRRREQRPARQRRATTCCVGGRGRDILIGGDGRDFLFGGRQRRHPDRRANRPRRERDGPAADPRRVDLGRRRTTTGSRRSERAPAGCRSWTRPRCSTTASATTCSAARAWTGSSAGWPGQVPRADGGRTDELRPDRVDRSWWDRRPAGLLNGSRRDAGPTKSDQRLTPPVGVNRRAVCWGGSTRPIPETPCEQHSPLPRRRPDRLRGRAVRRRGVRRRQARDHRGRAGRGRPARAHHARTATRRPPTSASSNPASMTATGEPEVVADRGAAVTWDGQRLPGVWLAARAVESGRRARRGSRRRDGGDSPQSPHRLPGRVPPAGDRPRADDHRSPVPTRRWRPSPRSAGGRRCSRRTRSRSASRPTATRS